MATDYLGFPLEVKLEAKLENERLDEGRSTAFDGSSRRASLTAPADLEAEVAAAEQSVKNLLAGTAHSTGAGGGSVLGVGVGCPPCLRKKLWAKVSDMFPL